MKGLRKKIWRAPGCRFPHLDGCCRRLDDLQLIPRMLTIANYSPIYPASASLAACIYALFGNGMDTLLDDLNGELAA